MLHDLCLYPPLNFLGKGVPWRPSGYWSNGIPSLHYVRNGQNQERRIRPVGNPRKLGCMEGEATEVE